MTHCAVLKGEFVILNRCLVSLLLLISTSAFAKKTYSDASQTGTVERYQFVLRADVASEFDGKNYHLHCRSPLFAKQTIQRSIRRLSGLWETFPTRYSDSGLGYLPSITVGTLKAASVYFFLNNPLSKTGVLTWASADNNLLPNQIFPGAKVALQYAAIFEPGQKVSAPFPTKRPELTCSLEKTEENFQSPENQFPITLPDGNAKGKRYLNLLSQPTWAIESQGVTPFDKFIPDLSGGGHT